jgi:glycopeptide antibiotics resistance protein
MVSPAEVESTLGAYPGFAPGVLVSILVAYLTSSVVGAFFRVGRIVGGALVFGLLVIISATLTPGGNAPRLDGLSCDLSRIGIAPLHDLLRIGEVSLNVVLFMPLGAAIGLLPRSRRKAVVLAAAIALPFVIETIQLLVPILERACQSADVSDNLTGLILGLGVGTLTGWAVARLLAGRPGVAPGS